MSTHTSVGVWVRAFIMVIARSDLPHLRNQQDHRPTGPETLLGQTPFRRHGSAGVTALSMSRHSPHHGTPRITALPASRLCQRHGYASVTAMPASPLDGELKPRQGAALPEPTCRTNLLPTAASAGYLRLTSGCVAVCAEVMAAPTGRFRFKTTAVMVAASTQASTMCSPTRAGGSPRLACSSPTKI